MEYVSKNTTKLLIGYTKDGRELSVWKNHFDEDTFRMLLENFLTRDLETKTRKRIENALRNADRTRTF
ncbi:MAG: hypothetical protein GY777_15490 [Candidatus Brocadiaceae bacterium]|nr:hypothetical protein [Candidatus Brocadiaceae bacterium]